MSQTVVFADHLGGSVDFTRHEALRYVSSQKLGNDKRDGYAPPKDITLSGRVDLNRFRGFRYHLRVSAITGIGTMKDDFFFRLTLIDFSHHGPRLATYEAFIDVLISLSGLLLIASMSLTEWVEYALEGVRQTEPETIKDGR
jgi:hypothetical protein